MTITQVTTFPATPTIPGGNQVTATGTNGTELKASLVSQMAAKVATGTSQAAAAQAALDAINT